MRVTCFVKECAYYDSDSCESGDIVLLISDDLLSKSDGFPILKCENFERRENESEPDNLESQI